MKFGTLYGVSVGTGDPELITVKGLRILQGSAIVAFPAGIDNRLGTAQSIISIWLQPHQQTLPLKFPYVRDLTTLQTAWSEAAREVGVVAVAAHDVGIQRDQLVFTDHPRPGLLVPGVGARTGC